MATEIQFGGDYDAFPLWEGDDDGLFDINLQRLRRELSPRLAGDLDEWARRWADVDGGDRDDDSALADALIDEARLLADRVRDELGPGYVVSFRWDDLAR